MQSSIFDLLKDKNQETDFSPEEQEKIAKLEEEKRQLLERVSSATTNKLRDKVAWILNHYPETRNSDITLQIKFWETFENDVFNGYSVLTDDLYKLTKLTSIARERARIQNTYKLFLASLEVREKRGTLSEEEKDKAISEKSEGWPALIVYMDESGKNAEQLIVGSMWFLEGGYPMLSLQTKLLEFKESLNFKKEFHFTTMSRNDLPAYIGMIKLFLQQVPTVSFKLISVPTAGIRNKQEALNRLFYHLLIRGVETENETSRAVLPRILQVWKDAEEEGADRLLVADLDDKLKQAAASLFSNQLDIDEIRCVSSENNIFIQVVDLFTASANRVLNQPGSKINHKDQFAEFFLEALGVGKAFSLEEPLGDMVVHISL